MPRDGTATRERILDVAERLFIEQGYSATSLDQLLAESNSSKGAFFHHFGSKADLAEELVARYVEGDLAQLEAGLAAASVHDDPATRAVEFVRYFEERGAEIMSAQSGCLYATVLAERDLVTSATSARVAKATLAWRAGFADLIRDALDTGSRSAEIDVEVLADHLYTTFEGAFILCRTLDDPRGMGQQLGAFRQLLEALLDRD